MWYNIIKIREADNPHKPQKGIDIMMNMTVTVTKSEKSSLMTIIQTILAEVPLGGSVTATSVASALCHGGVRCNIMEASTLLQLLAENGYFSVSFCKVLGHNSLCRVFTRTK